jgi:NADH:quinone reductase (non-electrogenic)
MRKQHVLIVGGGFGGIKAALELSKRKDVVVTLLSDKPDFRYYPSLYHTATGGLHTQSSIPLSDILPIDKVTLARGTAERLDRDHKTILTSEGHIIPYDKLVLALGVVTNYFGIKGLDKYSYGIKSLEEIARFKKHLHQQLIEDHQPDHNFVIVGAGPTGIELAGALPAYMHTIMQKHGIKHRAVHIDLIEAAPRLLPHSPKSTSRAVRRQLHRLGIKLYLGQTVQAETYDDLMINGKPVSTHTVVWTAGTSNHPFFKENHFALSDRAKVIVNSFLESEPHIYVIGDNAATKFSGFAQTALYDGSFVARNIIRALDDKDQIVYKPKQPIAVIPAGPHWATVDGKRIHLKGRKGWLVREVADYVAFHDYEPWWKAAEQWSTEFGEEEHCPVCLASQIKG